MSVVEHGVEEEVDGRPPAARPDAEPLALGVDVVRAVRMAGVSQVLVVARGARETERIVAPARILDELEQGLVIDSVVLREEARGGIERAHQGAGGGGIDLALDAPVEGAPAERLEVGALAPLHVDDLDELARPDLVASGGARLNVEIDQRLRERGRRPVGRLHVRPRLAADVEHDLAGGALLVDRHRTAGGTGHDGSRGGRDERRPLSGTRFPAEQPHRGAPAEVEATGREDIADALRGGVRAVEGGLDPEGRPGPARTDEGGVGAAGGIEHDQLAGLPSFPVDDRQLISGVQGHGARAPARDRMPLDVRRQQGEARDPHRSAHGRRTHNGWRDHVNALPVLMRRFEGVLPIARVTKGSPHPRAGRRVGEAQAQAAQFIHAFHLASLSASHLSAASSGSMPSMSASLAMIAMSRLVKLIFRTIS